MPVDFPRQGRGEHMCPLEPVVGLLNGPKLPTLGAHLHGGQQQPLPLLQREQHCPAAASLRAF